MKFILFVIDSTTGSATGNEIEEIDSFNDYLKENNHWVMAAGIGAPETATLVDNRNEKGESAAGSLIDSPDFYSGFWIVEAESDSEAKQLAFAGSLACNRRVEIRPFL